MKRDFDLIRILLLEREGDTLVDLSPYNQDQINYHKALIIEAGLAEGPVHYPSSHVTDIPDAVDLLKLTWEGHEFLDKARSDTTWNRAKSFLHDKGVTLSLEALKIGLTEVVKNLLR